MAKAATQRALVIVESPTKARTIRRFLGDGYVVEASMGHVRDLPSSASELPASVKGKPWARLGVNVEEGFAPIYVVPADKKKTVAELKKLLKDADVLYIATDEDREGESIGWHLLQILKPKIPTHRMVFHEITEAAIKKALASPRELDERLVQAQEARRVLDRLVGYVVSPLLWKKVAPRLSAGRVQSVAVRVLVLRERERMAFVSGAWWDLRAALLKDRVKFNTTLVSVGGRSLATGRDFDENTGQLKPGRDVLCLDEATAKALLGRLEGQPFDVVSVDRKESSRKPYPPFTTSTLQQEANRKLGFSASRTMQVAQKLYENGHITYMRTDSVNLSDEAISAVRVMIDRRYGGEYLSPGVRKFKTKSKGAQEAHEAIRPAGTSMSTAEEIGLSGQEAGLFALIWKRTVATQMANARLATTTAKLRVKDPDGGPDAIFRASGRQVLFPGFFRAYVEGTDDPSGQLDDQSNPLPALDTGDSIKDAEVEASGHETRPPARFTEATLVKTLESEGIGRPSTYASIIDTIQRRGYVRLASRQLIPTFTALAVTRLLEGTLRKVVDTAFTASMEEWLDEIAVGADAQAFLETFYKDELLKGVSAGEQADAREVCTLGGEQLGPFKVRLGRYGPFIEYTPENGEKARSVSLPEDVAPADVNEAYVRALLQRAADSEAPLGTDTASGLSVFLRSGRFGPYVQLGEPTEEAPKPKRSSLPPGLTEDEVTFEIAQGLLALPRPLGEHPDGGAVAAGLGRYGPYVVHKRTFASLAKTDDVLTVELPRALVLLTEKASKTRKPAILREVGMHPEDGEPINVLNGRYGPYVKHGKTNASLKAGDEVESLTLERAVELIAERAAAPKRGRRKVAAKKSGAKKTKAKKSGAKKATAKKSGAKKATAKKSGAKKAAAKKIGAKKATAKKSGAKKAAAKKSGAEKAVAQKSGARKPIVRKAKPKPTDG